MIKKIVLIIVMSVCVLNANEIKNQNEEIECQTNKVLVWYDKMCSSDLERIAKENKDSLRIKRTLAKSDNLNLNTINFLSEEKDAIVIKRLLENKAVPENLKNKLIEELNLINTIKKS